MCLDILRNPTKAILAAKKPNPKKAMMALLESSVIFAIAAGILVAKTVPAFVAGSVITTFFMALMAIVLFSLVVYITTTTLGGRGKYIEGLTATAYSAVPVSAGLLVVALLAWMPFVIGVQIVVLALTLALGISMLHRGIKELYRVDMVTSFISVAISVFVILLAVYASVGISLLGRLASGVL
ncbi:MAG: hypothetical protein QT00_C0002G0315 [archaeon GW2011_AR5]|nr:MAG: hypothetical protein QT00_C0002G0315 [archaeon GW2011_AR5]